MAVISAENDFIRVEFHYDDSSSFLRFGESSAAISGSLYSCIAGGGYFSFYKEKLCQSPERQWATLVVIPKIPIYTITIEYDCDYEGDNTFGSNPLSRRWYSGETPDFGRCIWSKETYLRGNADRMELCIWSPPKEGYSTVDDPEEGEAEAAYLLRIGQYAKVFPILMGSFFCLSTTYVFGTLLTANGSLKQLNLVAASGVVINILLNLIVIPRFQSVGAACTSLFVQATTAFLQYLIAKRILKFELGGRYWLHFVLFFVSIIAITLLVKQLNINWMVGFLIAFAINCIAIFLTRLLRFREIVGLMLIKGKNV